VVNHWGTPDWSRAPVDLRGQKASVGPVTSGVHLLDRQVRDAPSVCMTPRMILSCPTSLWPRDSDRHSNQRNAQRPRWARGAISGWPEVRPRRRISVVSQRLPGIPTGCRYPFRLPNCPSKWSEAACPPWASRELTSCALQRRARAATEYAKIARTGHMTADVSRRILGLPPLRRPTVNPVPVRGPGRRRRPIRPQRGGDRLQEETSTIRLPK
jgi:hypothetical protein